jgi:pimeloyl-ACP methyl ester carboxylesterase
LPDGRGRPIETVEVSFPPYRFYETRSGAGTPVVLIHGMGGSSDWWRRNIDALAREHLVVAVDLIASGRGRRSVLPPNLDDVASILTRWIGAFDEPVHIVGNSMGGHIAMHVVAQRPDLIRSLTLVNSTGIPFEIAPGAHVANAVFPVGALSFGRILARDAFRSGPATIAYAFARLLLDDARELMRHFNLPALVVWGERDPLVPLKYGRQIAGTIPNARLVVIPKAGHVPMWENAEAVNKALLDFLRQADANATTSNQRPAAGFVWPIAAITNGIAHRQAGSGRDVVLIHGLGMSSRYFDRFARALFEQGLQPVAPDLPGFGESANARAMTPGEQAGALIAWAEELRIRDAIWIGHSLGSNAVAHVARMRPDLCRDAVLIGPLWSASRFPLLRLLFALPLDALREPLRLFTYVIPAYWRCGLGRWWMTLIRARSDLRQPPPGGPRMISGERDPLPDRRRVRLTEVAGAHACHFSHAAEVVEAIQPLSASHPLT